MTDHYSALGLRSDAHAADIKKAFRQLASLYHPDRNTDPDAPARPAAPTHPGPAPAAG